MSKDAKGKACGAGQPYGTVPVHGHKRPGERCRDSGPVDQQSVCVLSKVADRHVGQVYAHEELSPAEVRADKEHDEGKVEEVVEDVVGCRVGGIFHLCRIRRKQMAHVDDLRDKQSQEVKRGNKGIDGESRGMETVLLPDGVGA